VTWETIPKMTTLPLIPALPQAGDDHTVVALGRGAREPNGAARHRAKLPPRHLADLDLAARRAAVAELGEPAFRANQISTHYFGRLERDPAGMTDIPAAQRERLADALMP
jgi:23S rRNA (adenine2503-C2)-methyltransferase